MHILIYGSKGWIGNQFLDYLNTKNTQYTIGVERCDNIERLIEEIKKIKPTHVISFIGRTHGSIGNKKFTTID